MSVSKHSSTSSCSKTSSLGAYTSSATNLQHKYISVTWLTVTVTLKTAHCDKKAQKLYHQEVTVTVAKDSIYGLVFAY
jgi:hypothetical protein